MNERLYRSRDDRMISGVCAGLADRLDLDPAIVRVGWVVLSIVTGGLFVLLYIVMLIVVPEEPDGEAAAAPSTAGTGAIPGWNAPGGSTGWAAANAPRPGDPAAGWPGQGPAATGAAPSPAAAGPGAGVAAATVGAATAGAGQASSPSTGDPAASATAGWVSPTATTTYPDARSARRAERRAARAERRRNADPLAGLVFGAILVLLGAYFLLQQVAPSLDLGRFWPVIVIGLGVLLIARAVTRSGPEG